MCRHHSLVQIPGEMPRCRHRVALLRREHGEQQVKRRDRAILSRAVFSAQRADEAVQRLVEVAGELANVPGYASFNLKAINKLAVAVGEIYARLKHATGIQP
jgi:hypothetical protein